MKPIILIAAWQGYKARGDQDACRETYLKEWGHLIPHRFVYDREYKDECAPDEIIVDAPTGFMEWWWPIAEDIRGRIKSEDVRDLTYLARPMAYISERMYSLWLDASKLSFVEVPLLQCWEAK